MEWTFFDYCITDDSSRADPEAVKRLLDTSYWAKGRSMEIIRRTIANSLCLSVFYESRQIGFARIVTDKAVFAWIADVIVDEPHRGKGIGKKMMSIIEEHPDIPESLKALRTLDAYEFYEEFGFSRSEFMCK